MGDLFTSLKGMLGGSEVPAEKIEHGPSALERAMEEAIAKHAVEKSTGGSGVADGRIDKANELAKLGGPVVFGKRPAAVD